MILFLAFMVGFFSGYSEFTRNVALGILVLAFCGAVILVIVTSLLAVFSEVKPLTQSIMAVIAVSGVFLGIPLAYFAHRKEKLWKLQKDWEIEKREKELSIWEEKT